MSNRDRKEVLSNKVITTRTRSEADTPLLSRKDLEDKLSHLEAQLALCTKSLQEVTHQRSQLQAKNQRLRKDNDELKRRFDTVSLEVLGLETKGAELTKETGELNYTIQELSRELSSEKNIT